MEPPLRSSLPTSSRPEDGFAFPSPVSIFGANALSIFFSSSLRTRAFPIPAALRATLPAAASASTRGSPSVPPIGTGNGSAIQPPSSGKYGASCA